MLRAKLGDTFILGLDAENVRRLQAKQPIRVRLAELGGPDVTLLICAGATHTEITRDLADAIDATPEVRAALELVSRQNPTPEQPVVWKPGSKKGS